MFKNSIAIGAVTLIASGCSEPEGSVRGSAGVTESMETASVSTMTVPVADAAASHSERLPATESMEPVELAPTDSGDEGPDQGFPSRAGWIREEPDNRMRLGQFKLPAQADDIEDALLVVFSFGGAAGDVDSNLQRWIQMLEQEDGGDSNPVAIHSRSERDGMVFHSVDISGRFVAPSMPGGADGSDKPGWRLIGTVIEAGDRVYYVKLTGPQATVAHWRASYVAFLEDADPER